MKQKRKPFAFPIAWVELGAAARVEELIFGPDAEWFLDMGDPIDLDPEVPHFMREEAPNDEQLDAS